ncbi:chemokine XC receptor 1-like [Oreochromis aureus]|uniref:G-protein coupled receptors family 1 profile domain-containing protein n=1 Tax=Oreochromis aureus TaxID=47969 RepID=A0A668TFS2_OREAU|nr:chemokine XC receptor 1-like [Oreochromis aureus]
MDLNEDYFEPYDTSISYDFGFNESEIIWPTDEKSPFQLFSAVVTILIFCISLPGNSFLLWILWKEKAWKTTTDILLLQLTVSNLCFTLTLPFTVCNDLDYWVFGEWVCGVMQCFSILGSRSSLVILTAMSLHYYVSTVQVSCLCAQASRKMCVPMASIAIWLVCAAASIIQSVKSQVHERNICFILVSHTQHLLRLYMEICLFFLIPFLTVTFCYVHMWIMIRANRINSHQKPSKLNLGITVCNFLCWAPYYFMNFVSTFSTLYFYEIEVLYFISYLLCHIYCCLSPLFHIFGAQRCRKYLANPCNTLSRNRDGSNNGY